MHPCALLHFVSTNRQEPGNLIELIQGVKLIALMRDKWYLCV